MKDSNNQNPLGDKFPFARLLFVFAILLMISFMVGYSLATPETVYLFLIGYAAIIIIFALAFMMLAIRHDPNKVLPKHIPYKARKLTHEEQMAWRSKIKEYLEESYGSFSKTAAYLQIKSGVVVVAFPYDASSVPEALNGYPSASKMKDVEWRLWLGANVCHTGMPHIYPADILIIRNLRIRDASKVKHLFNVATKKMLNYV